MHTPGNQGALTPQALTDWARQAADTLAGRLRDGSVPRAARRSARTLLAEAFEALEAQTVGLALARRLDRAATRPVRPIGFRKRMGVRLEMSVVDGRLVDRLIERWLWAETVEARIQRFIDGLGDEVTLRLAAAARQREGAYPQSDLSLTDG
ncbi:MAG: hypothetical protein KC613_05515 [Myxococcales bacterium]|nr:hypothetical protein [Myxococcales bacterium]